MKQTKQTILLFLTASVVSLNAATFFGPTPYLSRADIPAGLYASGVPTFLEDFEDGRLEPGIVASAGNAIPPGFEGLIDSVDGDDGDIDGLGANGHSWFVLGVTEVKFSFPPGTVAAGLVWTDGSNPVSFSAFGPGNVPLGTHGPFSGFADGSLTGTTGEDRFFGVQDAAGIESVIITTPGGIELDHIQYEVGSSQNDYVLDSFTLDLGGGTSTGGAFVVSGTITASKGELMSGGDFSVIGEFLTLIPAVPPTPGEPTTIFDNSTGSENGGIGATASTWLASKFCLGSQPYQLDSLSLLLSSGNFGGFPQPPSAVRLQLYANDPVSGKPSADTGVIMNLSGLTNPITVGTSQWVKWTPATPFPLAANTCYWAVFSVESGVTAGQIASFTKPSGDAGTFGSTSSRDAGATWGTPDNFTNFKMLVQGTASSTPLPTPELAITAVEKIGSDLKLSFSTVAGQNYGIQNRDDLSSGIWTSLPGTLISGTGSVVEVMLPNAIGQPQQFYRVRISP